MHLATLSRTSAMLTHVTSLYSSGTLQNLHGAPPHHPFQNPQYPHPIPQRHIAPPCPSHLPKKTHTPPTSTTPHRTSLSTDHPNRSGAEQTSPPRLASTNPPAHPAAPCANIYLRKKHLDLPTRHSRCASPHVRHKRDGVLGTFFIPSPLHTSLCSRAPPFHRTCFGYT
jgi:hypothetical protein